MGGPNSGRRSGWTSKATTDSFISIDARRWSREGYLKPGARFRWQWRNDGEPFANVSASVERGRVILSYKQRSHGEDWQEMEYPVYLASTPCHMGGARQWFLCPARGCGRRVALLYGGAVFACRTCHQLAYPSQRQSRYDRALRRAENIRSRLDWVPGVANGHGGKPKGMHWRTIHRLCNEGDHFDAVSWGGSGAVWRTPGF